MRLPIISLLIFSAGAIVLPTFLCAPMTRTVMEFMGPSYSPEDDGAQLVRRFNGLDTQRPRIDIALKPVASGISQITDIQFHPKYDQLMFVLEKSGKIKWFDLDKRRTGVAAAVRVRTAVEEGLLGMAFYPPDPSHIFLHYVVSKDGDDYSRIARWRLKISGGKISAQFEQTLIDVEQPYQNHNAGQLQFGPDGYLYIGMGDGGSGGDPQNNGQNYNTLLGSMLRLDVRPELPAGYKVPRDNPFTGQSGKRAELWAVGLRNPWRFSFSPDGQLVVADVGQNKLEEITIVRRGENHGWNIMEATSCYKDADICSRLRSTFATPIYEYGRADGGSVTGGYVYTAGAVPALKGKYIFADFLSGRMWAINLPSAAATRDLIKKPYSLGKWPLLPSTFGRRHSTGDVFIGDFAKGKVYQIVGR